MLLGLRSIRDRKALASGTARAWLGRSPARLERLSAGGGIAMIALGAGLVLTGRRN